MTSPIPPQAPQPERIEATNAMYEAAAKAIYDMEIRPEFWAEISDVMKARYRPEARKIVDAALSARPEAPAPDMAEIVRRGTKINALEAERDEWRRRAETAEAALAVVMAAHACFRRRRSPKCSPEIIGAPEPRPSILRSHSDG